MTEPCARCGRDSELEIADLWLCLDCYHVAGSTCAGIGRVRSPAAVGSSVPGSDAEPIDGGPIDDGLVC